MDIETRVKEVYCKAIDDLIDHDRTQVVELFTPPESILREYVESIYYEENVNWKDKLDDVILESGFDILKLQDNMEKLLSYYCITLQII